ncbi:MAG: MFS transporter [Conexivisphaerales archaeon]
MEYKWVALSNTTIGTLMSSLDSNIVVIALPTIDRELPGTNFLYLLWILLGYQLVTASVLVNFGRLSDMYGRVKLYNLGFAVFTASSALCSISQNGLELVVFRMLQGVGAAFLFSNSAAIITDAFPPSERGKALGINQVTIVAGSITGLVFGGFLTSVAGWRSIFWVNVPIGIFATVWSHFKLKELGQIGKEKQLDVKGNISFVASIALILAAITFHSIGAMNLEYSTLMASAGLLFLALFIHIERNSRYPMFRLSLFRNRQLTAASIAIFLNALARGATTLVLVLYLQGPSMGLDPLTAGLYLIPTSISLAAFGPVSGWLSDKYGARGLATLGLLVSSIGFIMLAQLGPTTTPGQLLIPLVLVGAGMGLFASPNRASMMNAVAPEVRGITAGMGTTLVNVGSTFSLGIAFSFVTASVPSQDLQKIFLGTGGVHDAPWLASFIQSVHLVFYVSTLFLLAAIIPSLMRGGKKSSGAVT